MSLGIGKNPSGNLVVARLGDLIRRNAENGFGLATLRAHIGVILFIVLILVVVLWCP